MPTTEVVYVRRARESIEIWLCKCWRMLNQHWWPWARRDIPCEICLSVISYYRCVFAHGLLQDSVWSVRPLLIVIKMCRVKSMSVYLCVHKCVEHSLAGLRLMNRFRSPCLNLRQMIPWVSFIVFAHTPLRTAERKGQALRACHDHASIAPRSNSRRNPPQGVIPWFCVELHAHGSLCRS